MKYLFSSLLTQYVNFRCVKLGQLFKGGQGFARILKVTKYLTYQCHPLLLVSPSVINLMHL